jgi:hypothetical protein
MDQLRRGFAAQRVEIPHMFAFGSSIFNREWVRLRKKEKFFSEAGKIS